jgi:hypothetical protein
MEVWVLYQGSPYEDYSGQSNTDILVPMLIIALPVLCVHLSLHVMYRSTLILRALFLDLQ